MTLSENLYILINVIVVLIILISLVVGFKRGFVYQLFSLVSFGLSLVVAWIVSPILANHIPLFTSQETVIEMVANLALNNIAWFFIVTLVLKVVFAIMLTLFKRINKIPLIGGLNAIGGLITGAINGYIWVSICSVLLLTPLFTNGSDIRENTIIKPFTVLGDGVISLVSDSINDYVDSEGLGSLDGYRDQVEDWLIEIGVFDEWFLSWFRTRCYLK